MGRVIARKASISNRNRAACAFGNIITGHFKVDATRVRIFGANNIHKLAHFRGHSIKRPRFIAAFGSDGITMHWIR